MSSETAPPAGTKSSLKRRLSRMISDEISECKPKLKAALSLDSSKILNKNGTTTATYQTINETNKSSGGTAAKPPNGTPGHHNSSSSNKSSLKQKMAYMMGQNISPSSEHGGHFKKSSLRRLSSYWSPGPVPKPDTHRWFRWNILWFLIFCVLIIPLPLWLFPVSCHWGSVAMCISTVWMSLYLLLVLIRATYTIWRMIRAHSFGSYLQFYPKTKEAIELFHVVVMCAYKEPLELIEQTLESLKNQTVAKKLFVVVAFEQRTPEVGEKTKAIHNKFGSVFLQTMITVHPYGVPGEIPGKCSNVNYAAREAVKELRKMGLHRPDNSTLTSCDTDNLFPSRYFEFLGYDFYRRADRLECVWQAPLLYNYNLHQRPFFVRVTGMLRAVLTMGALIPEDINTMSVTSLSLSLVEKGYFHPAYQMDDIIFVLSRMVSLGKSVPIYPILFPVISGPTSGETYKEELFEWARQARRWTVGAAEVFHYFCVKFSKFSTISGISYGIHFTHYYGFVLCAMSLFNFVGLIASLVYLNSGVCQAPNFSIFEDSYLWLIPMYGIGLSYVFYAWILVINRLGVSVANVDEPFSVIQTLVDWLFFPLVLLGYSFIEFYALTEVGLLGKKSCKHDASNKSSLASPEDTGA